MLKWIRSWVNGSPKDTLSEILSDKSNRETLLGVLNAAPPTKEQIERDAARVVNYSNTTDYSIFAKEAWSEVLKSIDKLMSDKLSQNDVDFYRGQLSATINLLRISYLARNAKEKLEKERKENLLINQI